MMELESGPPRRQPFGVYTKSVVRSPVVRWILHARIRHRRYKDAVFVGHDFVHIKEIGIQGELKHIATKDDFDAQIRDAKVFDIEDDEDTQDFLVKLERDRNPVFASDFPPQILVLTLDSNDIVFIFYSYKEGRVAQFIQQSILMPSFDRILFQPGEHLAVDPFSRALAVAANEQEVLLYTAKPKDQIQQEIKACSGNWCPILAHRALRVEGVIHLMAFLNPPSDNRDLVILLLVLTDQRRTKVLLIDWRHSAGLHTELHSAEPINFHRNIPNILIPLRDASFLLITGNDVMLYRDILSGSTRSDKLYSPEKPPEYPGNSSRRPIWANWTRPRRSRAALRDKDFIYLVREDGLVYLYEIEARNMTQASHAGNLACHVGTAFASLGDEGDPDILAVAGETSSGSVVSIGQWPTTRPLEELSREDTMRFDPVYILTNWASVTDMVNCTRLPSSRTNTPSSEGLLMTSGRQPFGCITQIQTGLEARVAANVSIEFLRYATDVWALPESSRGSIILLLSMPEGSKLIELEADLSEVDVEVQSVSALDTSQRTLLAGVTAFSQIVQVTDRGICTSSSLHANFEDTSKIALGDDMCILAAALISDRSVLITAERHGAIYKMCHYTLASSQAEPLIHQQSSVVIHSTPLCFSAVAYQGRIIALVATEDGHAVLATFSGDSATIHMPEMELSSAADGSTACDSLLILQILDTVDSLPKIMAACGLRDGRLMAFEIDPASHDRLINARVIELGHSSVKLTPVLSDPGAAIAMTGPHTYLLRWDGQNSQSLTIHNIWAVDKRQPDYTQGPAVAATQLPDAAYLASGVAADALLMISGEDLLIANLEPTPSAIARQISVNGTPTRLIHSESLRSVVCSALCTDIRILPSRPHLASVEKRQIWPVIEFIPDRGGKSYSYPMQPGERVYALLEWTYRSGDDKTYSHILVGGSYVRHNGERRGKVTFLQPNNKNWEVVDVTERLKDYFEDEVYALVLYDNVTYVACAGESVYLKRYDQKWHSLCPAFKLASPGTHLTVDTDHSGQKVIVISTMRDSLIILRLVEVPSDEQTSIRRYELQPVIMGPRADTLIHHLVLDTTSMPYRDNDTDQYTLMTTRQGQLLGMISPKSEHSPRPRSGQLVFEVQLSRSLTRLARTQPLKHKGSPPRGVVNEYITASTTEGALYGIVLLESMLWRRLCWLQRLIEWSAVLSPLSFASSAYISGSIDSFSGRDCALPIGFSGRASDLAIFHTNNDKLQGLHIDGDILARVLQPGGREAVVQVLQNLAGESDGAGPWVKEHIDEELTCLDDLLGVVKKLDEWM